MRSAARRRPRFWCRQCGSIRLYVLLFAAMAAVGVYCIKRCTGGNDLKAGHPTRTDSHVFQKTGAATSATVTVLGTNDITGIGVELIMVDEKTGNEHLILTRGDEHFRIMCPIEEHWREVAIAQDTNRLFVLVKTSGMVGILPGGRGWSSARIEKIELPGTGMPLEAVRNRTILDMTAIERDDGDWWVSKIMACSPGGKFLLVEKTLAVRSKDGWTEYEREPAFLDAETGKIIQGKQVSRDEFFRGIATREP
mgnify:FL=1